MPDDQFLVSLAVCTEEAIIAVVRRLQQQKPEHHAYQTSGIEWATVDQLLTLINYLVALIGAGTDPKLFDTVLRESHTLYSAVRSQRRDLVPVS